MASPRFVCPLHRRPRPLARVPCLSCRFFHTGSAAAALRIRCASCLGVVKGIGICKKKITSGQTMYILVGSLAALSAIVITALLSSHPGRSMTHCGIHPSIIINNRAIQDTRTRTTPNCSRPHRRIPGWQPQADTRRRSLKLSSPFQHIQARGSTLSGGGHMLNVTCPHGAYAACRLCRLKRWHYTSVNSEEFFLGFAVVDLSYASEVFVYAVPTSRTGERWEFSSTMPLARAWESSSFCS